MAQFSIYKNKNPKTKAAYPFLMDVQSELLKDLSTRVVIPLVKLAAVDKKPIKNLTPVIEIEGHKHVLLVPQLAGITPGELGAAVASAAKHRDEIVRALDFLFTGI